MGFISLDAYYIASQICHTVEHILLQKYHRAEVFRFFLLLYSVSYIVDIARVFVSLIYFCTRCMQSYQSAH